MMGRSDRRKIIFSFWNFGSSIPVEIERGESDAGKKRLVTVTKCREINFDFLRFHRVEMEKDCPRKTQINLNRQQALASAR